MKVDITRCNNVDTTLVNIKADVVEKIRCICEQHLKTDTFDELKQNILNDVSNVYSGKLNVSIEKKNDSVVCKVTNV